jgi:D-beta-D-heptose 7-phosphate kinase / D-beta-D-heptose 1-phosphate adenosyltransferase
MSKLKTFKEIERICRLLRKKRKTIVFTNGCFDILHIGHIRLLKKAKAGGDVLVLGLNTDSSIRRIKGGTKPIIKEEERAEMLSALEMVDYIVMFSEDTPERLIGIIKPDILVKGRDYRLEQVVGRKFVESYGGRVVLIPTVKDRSTTDIIRKIQSAK